MRRIMRFRSITTLCLFGVAALVALKYPLAGLGICICCLIVYLRPDPPGVRSGDLRDKADSESLNFQIAASRSDSDDEANLIWTPATAIPPSPTAAAQRFTEPERTSPAAKIPGRLVSSGPG